MRPTRGELRLTTSAVASVDSIGRLGVPIALEKEAEAVVAPVVAARNGDIDRRPAHHEAALGLVVQHRDELGAIAGLSPRRRRSAPPVRPSPRALPWRPPPNAASPRWIAPS